MDTALREAVKSGLEGAGDKSGVRAVQRVGGGDINQAAKLETERAAYFVKWHENPPGQFFACETRGLGMLALSKTVRVPEFVTYGSVPGKSTQFLVLEWISPGPKDKDSAAKLGQGLAALHQPKERSYGLDHDNYIGRLDQSNTQNGSWVAFYRDRRLGVQRDLAVKKGRMPEGRGKMLNQLMARLDEWIDDEVSAPSLLHGDLWGGNWMATDEGEPVIIDPAVYVGDREADLAMTTLFGGFPGSFYAAYKEAYPLPAGYEDRQPLYQLYYQLCHLNLFGEGYGAGIDRVLRHYVGT